MAIDKSLLAGSTATLILKLLEQQDLYGYQMIERLAQQSDDTFTLKAGTLYPLLHNLRQAGAVECYDQLAEGNRMRKYYHLTPKGKKLLRQKQREWRTYAAAVNKVLEGGLRYVTL